MLPGLKLLEPNNLWIDGAEIVGARKAHRSQRRSSRRARALQPSRGLRSLQGLGAPGKIVWRLSFPSPERNLGGYDVSCQGVAVFRREA